MLIAPAMSRGIPPYRHPDPPMEHVFDADFPATAPRTPIQQIRINTPLATEMLSEAARELGADEAISAERAMLRIEAAVGIMRQLPASVIDDALDITLADLGAAVQIGIYDADYIRRLTAQMNRQVGRITSFDDDRIFLDEMIDTPPQDAIPSAIEGYDRNAVFRAAAALRRCARNVESGHASPDAAAATLRDIGRSVMRASRDLRYALAAEALMHMHKRGGIATPRLQIMSALLINDAEKVLADPSILGNGPLPLSIRHLDEILNPAPADPGPPRFTRPKAPRKRSLEDIGEDIIDELKTIKSLI